MSNRHQDALFIQQGACNPSGIAHSIVAACREMRADPSCSGTAYLTSDPALRLMVHQLAYICGIINGAEDFADKTRMNYGDCSQACREAAQARTIEEIADRHGGLPVQETPRNQPDGDGWIEGPEGERR